MKTKTRENHPVSPVTAAILTLAAAWAVYQADIPNPVIVLVVLMILFTAIGSNAAGAVSGACIILYALFFFSKDHSFIHYTGEGAYKCAVIVVSLIIIYLMVAAIRRKRDQAFERMEELNKQLEKRNEQLQDESDHDVLTGIYNRRGGEKKIEEYMAHHQDEAVLAVLDIDDFKSINDSYGHDTGDKALQLLSRKMEETFKDHSVLIRSGGDEFQIFIYARPLTDIEKLLEDFSIEIFHFNDNDHAVSFQISCGYAVYPRHGNALNELNRRADSALYHVKANGKHQAYCWNDNPIETEGTLVNFSSRSISENLPTAFLVYKADQSEQILVVSRTLLEVCECADFKEFMQYTGGTFRGFVNPEDIERVEKSIAEQIQANPYGLDQVDYNITSRNGKTIHIHDLGRLVHDPQIGDLFYVIVYNNDVFDKAF